MNSSNGSNPSPFTPPPSGQMPTPQGWGGGSPAPSPLSRNASPIQTPAPSPIPQAVMAQTSAPSSSIVSGDKGIDLKEINESASQLASALEGIADKINNLPIREAGATAGTPSSTKDDGVAQPRAVDGLGAEDRAYERSSRSQDRQQTQADRQTRTEQEQRTRQEMPSTPLVPPSSPLARQRDERGRFIAGAGGGGGEAGGGAFGAGGAFSFRNVGGSLLAGASRVGSGNTLQQLVAGVPLVGGILSANLGAIMQGGEVASQVELPALQAQYLTRGEMASGTQFSTRSPMGAEIMGLSNTLGIGTGQAAQLIAQSAMASGGAISSGGDIAGLTARGFNVGNVASMAGTARLYNLDRDMVSVVEDLSNAGFRGAVGEGVAQTALGYSATRRSMGLNAPSVGSVSRLLAGSGDPMLTMGALNRSQAISVGASQSLLDPFASIMDNVLKAYALQQTGGRYDKAGEYIVNMTLEQQDEALQSMGVTGMLANVAFQAKGMTLSQLEALRTAKPISTEGSSLELTGELNATRASRATTSLDRGALPLMFEGGGLGKLEALQGVNQALQRNQITAGLDAGAISALGSAFVKANEGVVTATSKVADLLEEIVKMAKSGDFSVGGFIRSSLGF